MEKNYPNIKETFELRADLNSVYIFQDGSFVWSEDSAKASNLEYEIVTREEFFTAPKTKKDVNGK
jgi:hypothetical protein